MPLTDLGLLAYQQNRKEEARKSFEEALNTFEWLAKRDSERFAAFVTFVQGLLDKVSR
jgi:hypothetical protein